MPKSTQITFNLVVRDLRTSEIFTDDILLSYSTHTMELTENKAFDDLPLTLHESELELVELISYSVKQVISEPISTFYKVR